MNEAAQLVALVRSATLLDLSVTTGVDLPCSPPEGQPPAQFLLDIHYDRSHPAPARTRSSTCTTAASATSASTPATSA